MLAVTIVASVRLVGIVLVSAFLVIPAATGQALARSLGQMLAYAVGSAVASVVLGLWLSWSWDLPSGAAIVLGAVADGKALLVANFDDAAVAAGMSASALMREVAPIVGGGGGGKDGMARAGGKDPSRMAEAIEHARGVLRSSAG